MPREAVALVRDRSRADLYRDRPLNLSLVRLMEVVGEAATRIPQDFRDQHPALPWQDVADLRNRLIHGYDTVNLDLLWAIVHEDLPPLIAQLETIVGETD